MIVQTISTTTENYSQLLSSHLNTRSESSLSYVYESGRYNLKNGAALLDLSEQHQVASEDVLRSSDNMTAKQDAITKAENYFLKEALSPFELARLSSLNTPDLLVKLYDVFENEAKRIAHRLHDESAQMLAVVFLELAEIAKDSSPSTANSIQNVVKLLDEVCTQLRCLSHELRPIILDQLGLMPALNTLISGVSKRSSLVINISGETEGRINPDIETVIYRSAQEALANICRHAQASHADVYVWRDHDSICCAISDNGIGFAADKNDCKLNSGLGLIGIRERVKALGGKCEISSRPGMGTTLQVTIPL